MTEKLESVSSRSTSGRLSSIHRQSRRSSQLDSPITSERLPVLHNNNSLSGCSSGPLSINSDPQDSTDLLLNENENISAGGCSKECLIYSNVCRGISCKRMFCDRFPKGRAVFIVLLINALESFAIFGAFNGLQERIIGPSAADRRHLAYLFLFFQWCAGRIFYPIAGLIADTWLGRYRTIKVGLWLMWLGFVIITVNESLVYHYGSENRDHTIEQYVLPILAVIFLIISSATVEANIIPFGADQIQQGASSSEMSSYFYYYYCSRTAGLLIGLILFLLLFCTGIKLYPDFNAWSENHYTPHTLHTIHPLFAVLSITVALILHFCTSQHYFKDRDYSNPLRLIINVLYYAATVKRQIPRYRRAFRYGEERKSRIELAKREYDGIFTSEEVEDVKTFLRICLVIFSLSGTFLTFGMVVQCNN